MDLPDLTEPFKRAVAPLGQFATLFPDATDEDIEGLLLDAFSEAQLDGFLSTYTATDSGAVQPEGLTRPQAALIILYASKRALEQEIRNRKTHVHYEAGPTVFEQDQAASVLVELLRQSSARLNEVRAEARLGAYANAFFMADQYMIRATSDYWLTTSDGRALDYADAWGL